MELMSGFFLMGILGILVLISGVCGIIVLIAAFQDGLLEGILCLFVPFYILYYGGWVFDHEKRPVILLGWLGPIFLIVVIQLVAYMKTIGSVV